jgi:iron complex transport system substrate-binding protein
MVMLSRHLGLALLVAAALFSLPGRAAEFTDSAERRLQLPDEVRRVMGADPASDVLVFALTPDKLVGWSQALSRAQQGFLPAKYARLPTVGRLAGPYPTAGAAQVARVHPDLIVYAGPVSGEAVATADAIQAQTGVPCIVLDGSIQRTPEILRTLGIVLGAGDRRLRLASYSYRAIEGVRGRLLIRSADSRPLVYYGRGADGLETGLFGALAMSGVDQVGVINVAARLGRGELTRVTREQVLGWNPDIIIAQDRRFYNALQRDPRWRALKAVRSKRFYLAPAEPFGWIDDPAGVNRMLGLYWLMSLFYPDSYEEDPAAMAQLFYQLFYGVNLNGRQMAALTRSALAKPATAQSGFNVPLFGAEPTPLPGAAPGLPQANPITPSGRGGVMPMTPQ